jgi:hypothetical protein
MSNNISYNDINQENISITMPHEDYNKYIGGISNYQSIDYNTTASCYQLNPTAGAIGSTGSCYGSTNYTFSNALGSAVSRGLQVTGNAEFEGDVKIKGVSITDTIEKIHQRLAILVPDPKKLEHFEALKRSYENYKTLESLCELPLKQDE